MSEQTVLVTGLLFLTAVAWYLGWSMAHTRAVVKHQRRELEFEEYLLPLTRSAVWGEAAAACKRMAIEMWQASRDKSVGNALQDASNVFDRKAVYCKREARSGLFGSKPFDQGPPAA